MTYRLAFVLTLAILVVVSIISAYLFVDRRQAVWLADNRILIEKGKELVAAQASGILGPRFQEGVFYCNAVRMGTIEELSLIK